MRKNLHLETSSMHHYIRIQYQNPKLRKNPTYDHDTTLMTTLREWDLECKTKLEISANERMKKVDLQRSKNRCLHLTKIWGR